MAAIEETWDNWRNNEGVIGKLRLSGLWQGTFRKKSVTLITSTNHLISFWSILKQQWIIFINSKCVYRNHTCEIQRLMVIEIDDQISHNFHFTFLQMNSPAFCNTRMKSLSPTTHRTPATTLTTTTTPRSRWFVAPDWSRWSLAAVLSFSSCCSS